MASGMDPSSVTLPTISVTAQQPQPASGFAPDVDSAITAASKTYGVPLDYMRQMAQIESGGDPSASNPSGAAGLYQFMPKTAQAFGLSDPYDPSASANAAAQLTLANQAALRSRLGRDPTPGELYLAHQQGAGGAGGLLSNPDAPAASIVGAKAVTQNGGSLNDTAAQFANRWTSRFGAPGGPAMQMPASAGGAAQATPLTPGGSTANLSMPDGSAQAPSPVNTLQSLLNGAPSALGAAVKGQQGQQKQQGGGGMAAPSLGGQPVSLQQARAMFDPSRFFQALQAAGIQTGGTR